mgnify:CR=1 FL=1
MYYIIKYLCSKEKDVELVKVESYEEGVFLLKFDNSIFRVALDIIDDEIIFELLGINDNPISAKIAIENPYDYEARSELLWANMMWKISY